MKLADLSDLETINSSSDFYRQQVRAELLKLSIRQDARILFEQQTESAAAETGVVAYDELPPESPELFQGVLLANGATAIVAPKETGKSLLSLEIQSSLLTGQPLWGDLQPAYTVARTVHFLGEHSSQVLQGLYHRTGLPHQGDLRIFGPEHLRDYKVLVSNGIRRQRAIDHQKRLVKGAGLVVYDPLTAFIQGQGAENDNVAMRALVDTMIDIAQSTGAGCLVLAHQGKPQMHQGQEFSRATYATRGASATEDAFTAVHYLNHIPGQKEGSNDVYSLKPTHFKGRKAKLFRLMRDNETCRHTLLNGNKEPGTRYQEDLKETTNAMILRIQQSNPEWGYRVCLKHAATALGISEETVKRRIGLDQTDLPMESNHMP